MLLLIAEELELLSAFLLLDLLSLTVALLDSFNLRLKFDNFILKLGLLSLKLLNFTFQISFTMFSLQLLSHGESDRGLIKGLVSGNCHLNFVSNSEEQ